MEERIKNALHLDEVNHLELAEALLFIFGGSSGTEKGYIYQKDTNTLEVKFNEVGNLIENVILSDNFPDEKVQEIEQAVVEKLIDNQEEKYAQGICFTAGPVAGFFRYKDLFQFLPVPDSAPKPPDMTSPQPFILQYKYSSSSDGMISAFRRGKEFSKWVRLLNVFLNRPIFLQDNTSTLRTWVMVPSNNHRSECLQNGYNYDGFSGLVASFSSFDTPVEAIAPEHYYDARGVDGSDLKVPNNLEQLFDKALSLRAKEWKKFYRASTWYAQSRDIWGNSRSSSFVALVSALESLEKEPRMCRGGHPLSDGADCGFCGQPKLDITLHFKELLDTYFPELQQYPEERNLIYRVRSELAHGSTMLLADDSVWGGGMMNVKKWAEDSRHRNLFQITKIVILRWLESQ